MGKSRQVYKKRKEEDLEEGNETLLSQVDFIIIGPVRNFLTFNANFNMCI